MQENKIKADNIRFFIIRIVVRNRTKMKPFLSINLVFRHALLEKKKGFRLSFRSLKKRGGERNPRQETGETEIKDALDLCQSIPPFFDYLASPKSDIPTAQPDNMQEANQQHTLKKLRTELRCRNLVNCHRLSMQNWCQHAKMCMQHVHLPTCTPQLVVGN